MRKLLISAAMATATIATAVPTAAMAQPGYGRPGYGWHRGGPTRAQVNDLIRDLNRAEQRIERAPGISRREAVSLRREAASIRFQLNRAARNGIGQREFNSLRAQVNRLQMRVRMERRDFDNRRY
jgi:Spy/CpxP family protein refolding chaperone